MIMMQRHKNTLSITFKRWDKKVPGNITESLLDQGESAGLILPYSCRGGCCGSCKAKLVTGKVKQGTTDGLSKEEQEQGYILLCCTTPVTDVEINHE
jgi:glycine betaine catabolism B